jgi:hypothetical protein
MASIMPCLSVLEVRNANKGTLGKVERAKNREPEVKGKVSSSPFLLSPPAYCFNTQWITAEPKYPQNPHVMKGLASHTRSDLNSNTMVKNMGSSNKSVNLGIPKLNFTSSQPVYSIGLSIPPGFTSKTPKMQPSIFESQERRGTPGGEGRGPQGFGWVPQF